MSEQERSRDLQSVAIVHDQLHVRGGAEVVLFEMARALDAPVYIGAVNWDLVPDDVEVHEVFDDKLGHWAMRSHYLVQDAYQMFAWQHVEELYEYDVILQNKTNPWWFVPKDTQTVVRYCHSTPRGLYDQFPNHGAGLMSAAIKAPMRSLFQQTIGYADAWATNSDLVQRRLDGYVDIPNEQVDVIYPPVPVDEFSADAAPTQDYYFTYSRLRGHKRIDEIVRAFNQLNQGDGEFRLVIGGDGPQREKLEELAGTNVDIVGYMDKKEKLRRVSEAKALVFAAENEDFGMVPIEAMAAGTPVLGVKEGFTQHQVLSKKNGILWPREGGHLRETIRRFERDGVQWSEGRIEQFAEQFSAERFRTELKEWVAEAVSESTVKPDLDTGEGLKTELTEPVASAATDGGEIDG